MFIIERQDVDYDDYPVGRPYGKIGPFKTYYEALDFLNHHHPLTPSYRRLGIPPKTTISINDLTAGLTDPEDYQP